MTTYYWRSEALKAYGLGHIIAVGLSVDEARYTASMQFEEYLRGRFYYLFFDGEDPEVEEYRVKFQADLAAEPTIIDGALCIEGSE